MQYKRSLAIRERAFGLDHPRVAGSLYNLADLYESEGRYADAEVLYRRSLDIREKAFGADHPQFARALNNLANLYEDEGRYQDAEPLCKRALAILEQALGPNDPDVARSLNNLANIYTDLGHYAEAEPLFQRALAAKEKVLGPDHPDVAYTLDEFATLVDLEGRYADAEHLYKRSLAILETSLGQDHPDVAFSLNNLASLYIHDSRYADALPLVRTAAQMGFPRKETYLAALTGAVKKSAITESSAFNESYRIVQQATSTAASKAISKFALRLAASGDQVAQLVRRDQDLSVENDRLDKLMVEAVSKEPSKRDSASEQLIRNRLRAIASERAQVGTALTHQFPNYAAFAKPEPLSVRQTQQLLAYDEALIVFDFDQQSYAWVFTQSSAEGYALQITAKELESQVKTLRNSLNYAREFDSAASYALYQAIFGPFAEHIGSKTRLSVITNGALSSLPIQLLVTTDPATKKLNEVDWLVRKYAIANLPSTASLKILRKGAASTTAAKPMIGFGDPVFDRTKQMRQRIASLNRSLPEFYRGVTADMASLAEALWPLPESADELRAVAKALGANPEDIKLGEAATVTDVKHEPLEEYRVIYFATHALVAGDVEQFAKAKAEPALALSIPERPTEDDDGLLRASDVAMLKMDADFVVLSACNTAAGDNPGAEALSGLARAFFYAGARSLIVSNWDVDSKATVALMTGLFEALKRDPHLSHAEALRLSMLKMIDNPARPEWALPKFWAPFIVVGEPQKN